MNYRHLFHAGNFADVLKHVVLIMLLKALCKKDAPFCFLDTHAGLGLYSLASDEANKGKEYALGISKILENSETLHDENIMQYLEMTNDCQSHEAMMYPGSPFIASKLLREHDRMISCELHPEDYNTLKRNIGKSKKIALHHMNGYCAIKAFLPPQQRRGLVLIDPPFEASNEFDQIIEAVTHIKKHWRSGQVMIWYPIKNRKLVDRFYRNIAKFEMEHIQIEITLNAFKDTNKMASCGLLLINPPWQLDTQLKKSTLPELAQLLDISWGLNFTKQRS